MIRPTAVGASPRSRILVVDDYEDAARSMAQLLEFYGHEVRAVCDGSQAIAAALDRRPDVLLLDLALPGLDGYQVATMLRREPSCADLVIIAISGYGREEDRQRSREAGIAHHLLKPVDPEVLLGLLSRP